MPRPCLPNDGTAERQYLDLIQAILDHGDDRPDRTGVGTRALHGETLRFDLSDGTLPLLTTKRVPLKTVMRELAWMLRGETNIRSLLQEKVTIWSEWPHDRYVKETGDDLPLADFEARVVADEDFAARWGDLGPVYGRQWRFWQGPDGKIYDQIADLLARLQRDPHSRRLLFHGWNVAEVDAMALPPCHLLYQYYVANGRLSCSLYQRSCDVALGVPFNLVSAALLLRMLAQQAGLEPGELFWIGHDVHLYRNHLEPIREQLTRTPRAAPRLELKKASSLFDYGVEHLKLHGYDPDPVIPLEVAV